MKNTSYLYAAGLAVLLSAPLAATSDDKAPAAGTTVTGCVTTSNDGKSFILTESSLVPTTTAKTWSLVAKDGVDLSKYANHKVEITGASDKSSSPDKAMATGVGAKLEVKSVKDISNTCS